MDGSLRPVGEPLNAEEDYVISSLFRLGFFRFESVGIRRRLSGQLELSRSLYKPSSSMICLYDLLYDLFL